MTLVLTVGPDTAAAGTGGGQAAGPESQNVVANEEMSMIKNQHRSFAAWLRNQRRRDDPVGDLARDAAADRHWPKAAKSLPRLLDYLAGRGACPGAVEACRRAWAEFRAEGPRSPTGYEGKASRRERRQARRLATWANVARRGRQRAASA